MITTETNLNYTFVFLETAGQLSTVLRTYFEFTDRWEDIEFQGPFCNALKNLVLEPPLSLEEKEIGQSAPDEYCFSSNQTGVKMLEDGDGQDQNQEFRVC